LVARFVVAAAIGLLHSPSPARAQSAPPPAERRHVYSPYEEETIDEVLASRHEMRDPDPEGKTVERVEIVRLDVFEPRDILPQWLNVFHVRTQEDVIRREVLLHEGDAYRQVLADDTIRNLRRMPGVPQLSAVLAVAATGSAPDRIVLLVITKDVWSLRLNWDLVAVPNGIQELVLQPSETNFLGTHQILGLRFILQPSAYTFGASYMAPHLGTSRVAVQASANVMVNRTSGEPEGTYGSLVTGQPLFSGKTEWSWDASVSWDDVIARNYVDAQLGAYLDPKTGVTIPFQYRERIYSTFYELTRSLGWDTKHDFTLAASATRSVYQTQFPGVDPTTALDFVAAYVPIGDTRVGPSLQYHTYAMRFLRVINFDTLALQEDYRLGHDVILRVTPTLRALGSSRDVIGLYGAAQYTWPMRDGLARVSVASTLYPRLDGPRQISDAALEPTAHLATPTVAGIGRIVLDANLLWRWRNYLNTIDFLGGDDRLRGYPTNFFSGSDVFVYNVELRTRPVEILTSEVGAVAFYDVGHAFRGFDHFVPYQSLGVGLRGLFPWLDRTVFRADLGFPMQRPRDVHGSLIPPYSVLISFGQAFATPTVAPAPVLPTGQGPDSP
jgi:hypothetical protein